MVYVYILRGPDNFFYVGLSEEIEQRLQKHNEGRVKFTKNHLPVQLVHQESHYNHLDARRREKFLKSGEGITWIKKQFSI